MLKYYNAVVSFAEIPDEISLCINITNCPCHCEGCHSSYLAEDIGKELTSESLKNIIKDNEGISCVTFMGGDINPYEVYKLCKEVKLIYHLKTAWYSGRQDLPEFLRNSLNGQKFKRYDYIKLGPYIKEKGPLNDPNTNQILYKINHTETSEILEDITHKFWHKISES